MAAKTPLQGIQNTHETAKRVALELEAIANRLLELMKLMHPLDLAAALYMVNCISDPNEYKEYNQRGTPAYVQYIAQLGLTQPPSPLGLEGEDVLEALVVDEAQRLVDKALDVALYRLWSRHEQTLKKGKTEPFYEAMYHATSRALRVRGKSYDLHLCETLKCLDRETLAVVTACLDFSIRDANHLVDTLLLIYEEKLNKKIMSIRQSAQDIRAALRETESDEPDDMINIHTATICNSLLYRCSSEIFAVTPDELAERSGISRTSVDSFLMAFSLEFGSLTDSFYRYPHPAPPVEDRPLVRVPHGEKVYFFCPNPVDLRPAIRPRVEALLNPDLPDAATRTSKATWATYQRGKKEATEQEVMRLLAKVFGAEHYHCDLTYEPVTEKSSCEVDGLVLIDRTLIFVEVKGGQLAPAAKRGAREAGRKALKRLVGEAHEQALRALSYVRDARLACFKQKDGGTLSFCAADYDDAILVSVTLESLEAFVTNLSSLQGSGILANGPLPWSVALEDLRVITDLVEGPTQTIHYLRRRLRINACPEIVAQDELDWLGNYLEQGLFFDDLLEGPNAPGMLMLSSFTTAIDDYYLYKQGQRSNLAPRPKQSIPEELRRVISTMERRRPPGYLHGGALLLDLGSRERKLVVGWMKRTRRLAMRGFVRDRHGVFGGTTGVSIVAMNRRQAKAIRTLIPLYVRAKASEHKVDHWIAILLNAGHRFSIRDVYIWRAESTRQLSLEQAREPVA